MSKLLYRPDDFLAQAWEAMKKHPKEFCVIPFLINGVYYIGAQLGVESVVDGSPLLGLLLVALLFVTGLGMLAYENVRMLAIQDLKKEQVIDLKKHSKTALKRLPAVIWTTIVWFFKVLGFSLLLIIPGIYKMFTYGFALKATQMEGVSGSKATRVSEALIRESGMMRVLGSYLSISVLYTFGGILGGVVLILPFIGIGFAFEDSSLVEVTAFLAIGIWAQVCLQIFLNYRAFEYMGYQEELGKKMETLTKEA